MKCTAYLCLYRTLWQGHFNINHKINKVHDITYNRSGTATFENAGLDQENY